MNRLKKFLQYSLGSAIGALLSAGIGVVLVVHPIGRFFVNKSYDLPFSQRDPIPVEKAVIVYMDEESFRQLQQSSVAGVLDRSLHARLLDRLREGGAKGAVFDVTFDSPSGNPESDQLFAKAIKAFGNVVIGADYAKSAYERKEVKAKQITPPVDLLMENANVGTVEMGPDEDLLIRRHIQSTSDDLLTPLSWTAAEMMGASVTKVKGESAKERWVNYYGPPGWIPNISYYRALNRTEDDPNLYKDKVVFIGARTYTKTAAERKDEYPSPYSYWVKDTTMRFMPGVEIQATLYMNLMRGDWLKRMASVQEINLVLLLGLVFGVGLAQLRPFFTLLLAILGSVVVTCLAYIMVTQTQTWFSWLIVVLEIVIAASWSIIFNSINLYVEKKLMTQSLSMYVSPSRVKQIIKRPEILKPGAEKMELSILFSDIANFTTMSEGMDSDDLAKLMNGYFESAVGLCIHKAEGTVVKFIGDAIFAIWNAPEKQENHQELACHGAILLRDQVTDFKGAKGKEGLEVRTRIGLHSGVANVGNFGSSTRIDYTAIGENINLASRMEGLNKYTGTDILITGDVEKAVRGKFITRDLGRFQLKGFEKSVEVFELLGEPKDAEKSRPWREEFAKGLDLFKAKKFAEAAEVFHAVEKLHPKDGPAKFFLKHIPEMAEHELPADWDGTIELKEK